ncbi:type IV pilin protein [Gudongella sp. SC589]|uniref:type IV pilin protein n=1 Tax=Gudongella sp. SC589 TaxID=3385990 RepID=UPI0039047713
MMISLSLKEKAGFTLIELIVVIAVLGILASIGIPRFIGIIEEAERATCLANRNQLERYYNGYLDSEGLEHTSSLFDRVMIEYFDGKDICPKKGTISFTEGNVTCGVHIEEDQTDQDGQGDLDEVPYL